MENSRLQRVEHRSLTTAASVLSVCLQEQERAGWELVSIAPVQGVPGMGTSDTALLCIFKRPYNWPHSDTLAKVDTNDPIDRDAVRQEDLLASVNNKTIKRAQAWKERDGSTFIRLDFMDSACIIISGRNIGIAGKTYGLNPPPPLRPDPSEPFKKA